jgi:hypothetical protein
MLSGCLTALFAIALAQAAEPPAPVLTRKQGPSPQGRLTLFAKDPATWRIIGEGPRGMLSFDRKSGAFSFVASRLRPDTGYLLVRQTGGTMSGDLLASGTTGRTGELRLSGTWREWSGKIWLVPAADVALSGRRGTLTAWHPEQILFEEKVLGIPCECDDD